jgi:hypothetical protein
LQDKIGIGAWTLVITEMDSVLGNYYQNRKNWTMRFVQSIDKSRWRRFIENHPDSSVFHTPEMYEVFASANGFEPKLWAAIDEVGDILALLLPVLITMRNGALKRFTTRATVFGSILYAPGAAGWEATQRLLSNYNKTVTEEVLYTKLRNLKDLQTLQPFLEGNGYEYEDHLNYLVDLNRNPDDIFSAISKSGRKAIRRSSRKGIILREVDDRSLVPVHYELLKLTHDRIGVPLADISLFEAVFDILVSKGMAKMLLAEFDNKYVAASLELPYNRTIYSWYSGYDGDYRKLCPNDFLVWHILQWGAENGYHCFDFGGAGAPGDEYGPREFKAKFGGQLVNYGFNICTHAPLRLAFGRVAYDVYRKARLATHVMGQANSPISASEIAS